MHIVKSVKVCQGLTKISANDGRHCEPPLAAKFEIGYYRRGRGSLPFVYREAGQNVKADRTLPSGAGVAALLAKTTNSAGRTPRCDLYPSGSVSYTHLTLPTIYPV